MSKYKIHTIVEQDATYDSKFSLPFSEYILLRMINGNSAEYQEDIDDMINPKRLTVRITIETKEKAE